MSLKWKHKQFINHGNRIAVKPLKYIGEEFVRLSTWKCNSITPSIRSFYNTGLKLHKQEIIQNMYNQMDLNINIVVFILNNNSAQVMNEKETRQNIRIYFTRLYDKENYTMEQCD